MGIAARIQHWSRTHPSLLQLFIRIILGVILLLKGIYFISNSEQLKHLILNSRFATGVSLIAGYTIFAHLLGGVLIIIGLFTRIAAIFQIPVLLGALFFILPSNGFLDFGSELVLTIVVLILLIYVLVKGSGEISMEDYLKKHKL